VGVKNVITLTFHAINKYTTPRPVANKVVEIVSFLADSRFR